MSELSTPWRIVDTTLGACRTCDTIKALPPHGPRLTETCGVCGTQRDFDQIVYDVTTTRLTRVVR